VLSKSSKLVEWGNAAWWCKRENDIGRRVQERLMLSAIQAKAAVRDVSSWYVRGETEGKDVLNVWYSGDFPMVAAVM
jgi:hypothetical protein